MSLPLAIAPFLRQSLKRIKAEEPALLALVQTHPMPHGLALKDAEFQIVHCITVDVQIVHRTVHRGAVLERGARVGVPDMLNVNFIQHATDQPLRFTVV